MFENVMGLGGRTALVTGAGSGLAEAIAQVMARAGAKVICAHDDLGDAERVAAAIRADGNEARAIAMDPAKEESVLAAFAELKAAGELADIVVLGAMMQGGVPAIEMSAAQWDAMHNVNARGSFLTAREGIRALVAAGQPGRIIALSTIGSEHPVLHGNVAYGSSKAALNQMCRNLAFEHAADGIRVNAIMPGAIPGNAPAMPGAVAGSGPGRNRDRHPCGFGNPEEIGWLAVYLAGPSANYITGQTIVMDGGFQVA